MTSQPLVASVCVDYLSHPLSAEGLLLCYQQITRQVAHAPLTAKEAASTFQNKSNTELDLLQQHSYNLAIPNKRDHRPAPVGCQAQLRRMQNALWRRSSQLSLAKDVALVQPETLNWQKECDVLWLYGPLYHPYFATAEQASPEPSYPSAIDDDETLQDYFNIALSSPSSMPLSISTATILSATETTVTTIASPTSSSSSPTPPCSLPSPQPQPQSQQEPSELPELPRILPQQQRHHRRMTTDETPTTTAVDSAPRPLRSASISTSDTALAVKGRTIPKKSSLKRLGTRQQQLDELRAFLKSQEYRTLNLVLSALEEAAAAAAAEAATAAAATTTATSTTTTTSTISCLSSLSLPQPRGEDGTCSAPVTPVMGNPPMLLALPLAPAPARYHFRSTDRQRRASFPKYVTHPASSSSLSPSMTTITTTSSSSMSIGCGHLTTTNTTTTATGSTAMTSGSLNGKQLRFSLEVQELVFLPSSPPFRVSRAKPIRANSDPAVHSAATSSYLAPSLGHRHQNQHHHYSHQHQYHSHQSPLGDNTCMGANGTKHSCIATAASNLASRNGGNCGRTMVVRIGADNTVEGGDLRGGAGARTGAPFRVSRSGGHHGLALDLSLEEEEEIGASGFEGYRGKVPREDGKGFIVSGDATTTAAAAEADYHPIYPTATPFLNGQRNKRKHYHHPTHYQSMSDDIDQDDDEENADETDLEDEIFYPTIETISEGDDYSGSSHDQDDGSMATTRRIDQQQQHKGVLWQMYTVVTGVRDIVAWCGSMVYYSSTL
ncbi:hypothetical protein DFQ27_003367 [Actinomortierella ambigua]|uniref:Uncharacterized protein n=1 Tax=Actinomortierella ambigua TaxID=1343610 RepID=A0A9P6QIF5_9FUNG|nr:hypothetical protein DFQ27_003367 [Actinomortierella ambigua]